MQIYFVASSSSGHEVNPTNDLFRSHDYICLLVCLMDWKYQNFQNLKLFLSHYSQHPQNSDNIPVLINPHVGTDLQQNYKIGMLIILHALLLF
jgi:hypothetical protein